MWLTDPDAQIARPFYVPDAEVPSWLRPKVHAEDFVVKGSPWIVVGGKSSRGIIVRKGKDLDSPAFMFRLVSGAKVLAESPVCSGRLHYRKITGDGPDFGWVSIMHKGRRLVEPDLQGQELTSDMWDELARI